MTLPTASLERALRRVGSVWHPTAAAHHIVYGTTGAGKSTLIKELLGLCGDERVLILDPKPHPDLIWNGPDDDPHRWGRPVTGIHPMFGTEREGGGPLGLWFRLAGTPDRAGTARRFGDALATVAAEGHCVLVLDDVREITRQLRLAEAVDSVMNLGRSANMMAILSATETGYVSGRAQAAMTWIGYTGGSLPAARSGAELLGWRGRDRQDSCASLARHAWIYQDHEAGSAGPVLVAA